MPRPSKLTPEVQKTIVDTIRIFGVPHSTAAARVGIDDGTLSRWLRRGAIDPSGIYREFRDAIEALGPQRGSAESLLNKLAERFPDLYGDPRATGRPAKITADLIERVCAHVRAGALPLVAAEAEGIDSDKFERWLERGAREESGPRYQLSKAIDLALEARRSKIPKGAI